MGKLLYRYLSNDKVYLNFYDDGTYCTYREDMNRQVTHFYLHRAEAQWKILEDGLLYFNLYGNGFVTTSKESAYYAEYIKVRDILASLMLEKAIWGDE